MDEYGGEGDGEPQPDPGRSGSDQANLGRWWPLLAVGVSAVIVIAVMQHPGASLATPAPHTTAQTPAPGTAAPDTAAPHTAPTTHALTTNASTTSAPQTSAPRTNRPTNATSRSGESPATSPTSEPPTTSSGSSRIPGQILGVSAGWDLFARTENSVIRIELAKGQVSQTAVPLLNSGGPVSFLALPDRVILRPLDSVPGYAVIDGQPASLLTKDLAKGGPAVIGPDLRHLWVDLAGSRGDALTLVTVDGTPVGPTIAVAADRYAVSAGTDGDGSVLMAGEDGTTHVMGGGTDRLLTSGTVVAVGRTGIVVTECPPGGVCKSSVIDHGTGTRRPLQQAITDSVIPGLISPDGRVAAVFGNVGSTASDGRLSLINLTTGARRLMPGSIGAPTGPAQMVWSPDSRWLFVVTRTGQIAAIDPTTGLVHDLGVALPPVVQLAVRSAN